MDNGRRVSQTLTFSGKKVDVILKDYLEAMTYTDVASGSSDSLSITLQNIDEKWMRNWYPKKGNTVSGKLIFKDWTSPGTDKKMSCGTFTMDDIKVKMGPKTAEFSCLSAPAKESFKTRERNKTWEKITIQGIAKEICGRYGLTLKYSGPSIMIDKLEQSDNDSSFLSKLCDDYGLGMKIYRRKIVIYDIIKIEKKKAVATLSLKSFTDISFTDGIYGTYTGARVSYKKANDDDEISIYIGTKGEHAKGSRVMKVNNTCSSEAEARRKGAAQVNKSNMKATTMSCTMFPNPKICAGVCIRLSDEFGKLAGKYFVDKVTWDVGSSATTQKVEAHKVKKKVNP